MPSSLTNLQPGMAAASGDKLGDLVDKMDSVRLDSKADSETSEAELQRRFFEDLKNLL